MTPSKLMLALRHLASFQRRYFATDLATLCWLAMIMGLFLVVVFSASPRYTSGFSIRPVW